MNDITKKESEQFTSNNNNYVPEIHTVVNFKSERVALPPDGGWGWLVVFCAATINCVYIGVILSFGILFSEILNDMNVSTTYVTWILNVNCLLWYLSTMMVGPLYHHLGARLVATVSSLISSVGFMLLYFTSSPIHILLLFGIVIGISGGPASNICFIAVGEYFDRRRGTATGIVSSGIAVGQIVIPQCLRALLDEYGFRGASLIIGAFVLHCCVLSQVFHPVRQHCKWTAVHTAECSAESEKLSVAQGRKLSFANNSEPSPSNILFEIAATTVEQLKQMRRLKVFMMAMGFTFILVSYVNFMSLVPFAMQAAGHSPQEASNSISLCAVGGAVIRVTICICSDKKWFNRKFCYISGSILATLSIIATAVGLRCILVVMCSLICYGIGIGFTSSTYHALIMDTCGRHLYVSTITVTSLYLALFSITAGPIIGLIRDHSSYTWSLLACSVLPLCCALMWLLECVLSKITVKSKAVEENFFERS